MSSFKNAQKSRQKTHRERSQPESRKHLGLLEKKKDYKLRADDYQRKQNTLKALKRKALDKNPDEFYFKMVKTQLEDGVHQTEDVTPVYTDEQLKLIQTQDVKYINYKRSTEIKKIEKLKSTLHMLDAHETPKNKHTVFLDSKKAVKEFDPVQYFDTHPSLVDRAFNRPRKADLSSQSFQARLGDEEIAELTAERSKKYKELGRRIDREKELLVIQQKMDMKKHLLDKKSKKKKVAEETLSSPAQYRWVPQRKK